MRRARRSRSRRRLPPILAILLVGAVAAGLYAWGRAHPEDLPWTSLALTDPVGLFTGRKLAALTDDAPRCRSLLGKAGVRFTAMPATGTGQCHYADGVRLDARGAREIGFIPAGPIMACPVAAGLALWEWQVVQPAARRHLRARVTAYDQLGTYNCRRIAGRHAWSEHATADAIDIAGFQLDDGRRISVARDWKGDEASAAFLREVRDGACSLFATVLSPDYNAAHRDHLHLDQAERGAAGWRSCR